MTDYEMFEYPNGIRVVHKQIRSTKIAHVGIMLDIGSRDETEEEQGIAHFWEHMAFKGTQKRKAYHIINRLESLGGELNAYTTKEKICFYASLMDIHLDKAVELLTDITFNSVFPEKQIEVERGVILEEMSLYRDTPEDALQDEFDELLFPNHMLGKNILGSEQTVNSFHREDFQNFVSKHLNTHKIVISSVGNFTLKKVLKYLDKYVANIPSKNHTPKRTVFKGYSPIQKEIIKPITQSHCAIGSTAYEIGHPDRLTFFMLLNILGGPGMNSRLNLSLRENHGLVYGIDASYSPYTDTGAMGIYFATEKKNLKKSINLVWKEFERLRNKPLGTLQLNTAKQQLKGQLAMSEENYSGVMLVMAKSLLDLNKIRSIDEIFSNIDAITASQLQDIAQATLVKENMSILSYIPG